MNVTEKQKQILVNFMHSHPDFGRGRLRYNRENKRKIDELWEEIASALNCAGSGPQKSPKEWAKTWRDWKSNLLKRVATHKSYAGGTRGGPPKTLNTTPTEDDLLDFLTPEASGIPNIPEGGAIDNNSFSQNLPNFTSTTQASDYSRHFYNNEMNNENLDIENLPTSISSNVLDCIENIQQIPKQVYCTFNPGAKNKRRCSYDGDTENTKNKTIKKQAVKQLFEQHASDYSNIQEQMLQLKKEKLSLTTEELELKKMLTKNSLNS